MTSKRLLDEKQEWHLTFILTLIIISALFALSITKITIMSLPDVKYDLQNKVVNLSEWTLEQKIGQMVIVLAKNDNGPFIKKLNIGGVFMGAKETPWNFIGNTKLYQNNFTTVPLLITTDLEGCTNPFETFYTSPALKDIKTEEEAYELGKEHGTILKNLGFNMDFSPVVDLKDNIWKCRTFNGSPKEIARKSVAYINGLQEMGILATSKHYPGETLSTADPHKYEVSTEINKDDLYPFEADMQTGVDAIMLNHLIVSGEVNSDSKPTVVSKTITQNLTQQYSGLIITDEVHMMGLRKYYSNEDEMYIDLFKADNDMILNLNKNIEDIYKMIHAVKKAVERGEISEERIDKSVEKILKAKGIKVVY